MTFWDNAEISELNRPAIRSDDLLHLADYYETDKGRKFGNKHGYTELYERKFLPRRHNKLRILEIGIAGGSSLKMWASWFTDAEVHGIDINGNCRGLCKEFSNIRIHIGDASTFDFGETRFDIVIDDGSHLADDIIKTYANLGRFCHEDTIYVIEDMHSTRDEVYIEAFRLGRGEGLSEVAWRDLQGFTRLRKFIAELSVSLQVEVYNEKIAFIAAPNMVIDNRTGVRFSFGENWTEFNQRMLPHRVRSSAEDLREWVGEENIRSRRVVDIGSGSGLHSLAFLDCGAKSVTSVDVDPSSVAATRSLQLPGVSDRWVIKSGSILDAELPGELGQFDIVYSWGVLHHTGAMWNAIRNCTRLCGEGGLLMIAIYQGGHAYEDHLRLKQLFNRSTEDVRDCLVRAELGVESGANLDELLTSACMQKQRGMNRVTDAIDWLGGLPYETARVSEILAELISMKFTPLRVAEDQQGGCSVFLLRKDSAGCGLSSPFLASGPNASFQTWHDFSSWLRFEWTRNDVLLRTGKNSLATSYKDILDQYIKLEGKTHSGLAIFRFFTQWLRSRFFKRC